MFFEFRGEGGGGLFCLFGESRLQEFVVKEVLLADVHFHLEFKFMWVEFFPDYLLEGF